VSRVPPKPNGDMGLSRMTDAAVPGWSAAYCRATPPPSDQPSRCSGPGPGPEALGQQRVEVVSEVPDAAARVHRCPLRTAEAPQVGGDAPVSAGQRHHGLGEEPGGGHVAVHQHQRRRVRRAGREHVRAPAVRVRFDRQSMPPCNGSDAWLFLSCATLLRKCDSHDAHSSGTTKIGE